MGVRLIFPALKKQQNNKVLKEQELQILFCLRPDEGVATYIFI